MQRKHQHIECSAQHGRSPVTSSAQQGAVASHMHLAILISTHHSPHIRHPVHARPHTTIKQKALCKALSCKLAHAGQLFTGDSAFAAFAGLHTVCELPNHVAFDSPNTLLRYLVQVRAVGRQLDALMWLQC